MLGYDFKGIVRRRKLKTLKKIAFNNLIPLLLYKNNTYSTLTEEESEKIGLDTVVNYRHGFNAIVIIL